jgi:hypothetical protein
MPMIEIWDGPAVRLSDLLDRIPERPDLNWSVMEIWAIARDDTDVVALGQRADDSPTGLRMSAAELRDLAARLEQLVDGIAVGYRGDPPVRDDPDLRTSSAVVIEAIDSTLWRVYADDPTVIERVRRTYRDVRDVVPEIPIPPVHEQS